MIVVTDDYNLDVDIGDVIPFKPTEELYFIEYIDFGNFTFERKYEREEAIEAYRKYLIDDFTFEMDFIHKLGYYNIPLIFEVFQQDTTISLEDFSLLVSMYVDDLMNVDDDLIKSIFDLLNDKNTKISKKYNL